MTSNAQIKKIIKFLKDNEVTFVVPGCYNLPENIVIQALEEFFTTGKSDLVEKHKRWIWGCWDLDCLSNSHSPMSTINNPIAYWTELKKLKIFFRDYNDLDKLDKLIDEKIRKREFKKTYKYQRKNAFTAQLKNKCKKRDNFTCVKCGSKEALEVDHIVEIIDGGDNSLNNLQILCCKCHIEKTSQSVKKRTKAKKYGK